MSILVITRKKQSIKVYQFSFDKTYHSFANSPEKKYESSLTTYNITVNLKPNFNQEFAELRTQN